MSFIEFLRSLFQRQTAKLPVMVFKTPIGSTSFESLGSKTTDLDQNNVAELLEVKIPNQTEEGSVVASVSLIDSTSYVFLDTETTGLNQDGRDEVLEIAIIDNEGKTLIDTLVRPVRKSYWPDAQAIHGISPQDVLDAPTWETLLPKISSLCAGKTVVIYNSTFDTGFFPVGFFISVECAMRSYAELNSIGGHYVKLSDAAVTSGFCAEEKYHRALQDARACRHIWLFEILPIEKEYPKLIEPIISTALELDNGARKPLVFESVFARQLRFVTLGCRCKLWTKPDRLEINIYRQGTIGGSGKIASLLKQNNPEITERMEAGFDIELLMSARRHEEFFFDTVVRPSTKLIRSSEVPMGPVTYSPIDDDIFRCFIAHQTGMCDDIGTWEEFHRVAAEISRICQTRGGRLFKTKAKGAKYAIIFDTAHRNTNSVSNLQKDGFKVTTFDQAVEHFGLKEMWNCQH